MLGNDDTTTRHEVVLSNEYYQNMTAGKITPKELVRRSFEFLLKKEPKESILPSFSLEYITEFFDDYESTVQMA